MTLKAVRSVVFLFALGAKAAGQTLSVAPSKSIQSPPVPTVASASVPQISEAPPTGVNFPRVGSIKQDFSPEGLERLWNIVRNIKSANRQ